MEQIGHNMASLYWNVFRESYVESVFLAVTLVNFAVTGSSTLSIRKFGRQ